LAAKKTKEQAIQDAIKVHGNKYDYSLVDYKNCYTKVKIICKEHGIFEITLTNHITTDGDKHLASGCPKCGLLTRASKRNGFNIAKDGTLYVLFANPDIVKVGITNRDLQVRLKEINKNNIYTFKPMYFKLFNGLDALSKETEVLRFFKSQLNPVESVFDGSTACFHAGKYSIDALVAFVRNMV